MILAGLMSILMTSFSGIWMILLMFSILGAIASSAISTMMCRAIPVMLLIFALLLLSQRLLLFLRRLFLRQQLLRL